MKIKLISFVIIFLCIVSSVMGGLFSVHRSEGRIVSPEVQEKIEAFLEQYGVDMPKLPAFLTE